MPQFRSVSVRDSHGLLWALCEYLQGDITVSFEGDLSGLGLTEIPGASQSETATLKRQTLEPELDFCVVPINSKTLSTLKQQLAHAGVLGRNGQVIHIQIAQGEQLALIACDNFHPECTVVSKVIDVMFLQGLVQQSVLRNYGT